MRRSTTTAMLQIRNANSVPMLTSTTISASGTSAAMHAMKTPKPTVISTGVWKRGWTLARRRGARPSRHIAKKIRVWPYMIVSTTLVIDTSAPIAIIEAPQSTPAPSLSAAASGASASASWSDGSAPTATIATMM